MPPPSAGIAFCLLLASLPFPASDAESGAAAVMAALRADEVSQEMREALKTMPSRLREVPPIRLSV
jgi:hypothetical protein